MEHIGRLNEENRIKLHKLGAKIALKEAGNRFSIEDLVANYHVSKVLMLREQLRDELSKSKGK